MKMIGLFLIPTFWISFAIASDEFAAISKNVESIRSTLDQLKAPLPESTRRQLVRANAERDTGALEAALEGEICLKITINPEGRVRVARGPAVPPVKRNRPAYALLRIENQSGGRQELTPKGEYTGGENPFQLELIAAGRFDAELRGALVEYRLLKLVCHDAGKRELTISFQAGQGTQDLGFRGEVPILFDVSDK